MGAWFVAKIFSCCGGWEAPGVGEDVMLPGGGAGDGVGGGGMVPFGGPY